MLGVSWVWTVGVLLFHSAISIALPILLFRLAFPGLKSKSLVSISRAIFWIVVLFSDSVVLFLALNYWAGWPIILSSLVAVAVSVLAARAVPASFLATTSIQPRRRPLTLAILGGLFFPAAILTGAIAEEVNAPALIPMASEVIFSFLILRMILGSLGSQDNKAHKPALAVGLVVPIMVFGLVASLGSSPLILVADLAFATFLRRLWKKYNFHTAAPLASSFPTIVPGYPGSTP